MYITFSMISFEKHIRTECKIKNRLVTPARISFGGVIARYLHSVRCRRAPFSGRSRPSKRFRVSNHYTDTIGWGTIGNSGATFANVITLRPPASWSTRPKVVMAHHPCRWRVMIFAIFPPRIWPTRVTL